MSEDDALSYVRGYTVANDVSARDLQFADGQWVRAKSLDTFCPLGAELVERRRPAEPQAASRASTARSCRTPTRREMIFGVAELISFCSHSLHARARRRDPHRHAVGLRRVHGARSARSRTATSSSARSRASACCATRWWRSEMKVHLPTSVDEAVGLLGEGVLIAGGTHRDAATSRPTESLVSLRRAGPRGHRERRRHASRSARRRRSPQVGREVAVPARRDRVDRLADDPQPGHGRRQPVRAAAARRPRGLPARARRAGATSTTAATSACSSRGPRDERQLHGARAAGSTRKAMRRKQNSRVDRHRRLRRRRGSRSAASPREPVRALAAEEALAERRHRRARPRPSRRGRRPVRRRLRQRLVPPPRPSRPRPQSSEPMPSSVIELEVNGEPREFLAPPGTTLLSALRDTLGLTAAKRGCGAGHVRHLHLPARRRRRHVLPGPGRDRQRLDASRRSRA